MHLNKSLICVHKSEIRNLKFQGGLATAIHETSGLSCETAEVVRTHPLIHEASGLDRLSISCAKFAGAIDKRANYLAAGHRN